MLQRIERGDSECGIGAVFEVATLVGVTLFEADEVELGRALNRNRDKLALLPKSIRKPLKTVHDDF